MKRNQVSLCESDYFNDKEGVIQLQPESCSIKGVECKPVIDTINKSLALSLKFIEKKEYTRALSEIKVSHASTFTLTNGTCLACARLFRQIVEERLELIITDLKKMTTGLFARKSLKYDLEEAQKLYSELKSEK